MRRTNPCINHSVTAEAVNFLEDLKLRSRKMFTVIWAEKRRNEFSVLTPHQLDLFNNTLHFYNSTFYLACISITAPSTSPGFSQAVLLWRDVQQWILYFPVPDLTDALLLFKGMEKQDYFSSSTWWHQQPKLQRLIVIYTGVHLHWSSLDSGYLVTAPLPLWHPRTWQLLEWRAA